MEEKDQNSLTIGDILDQLAKPSVIQSPKPPTPEKPAKVIPTEPRQQPSGSNIATEIKLPQMGGGVSLSQQDKSQSALNQPAQVKLSIRTMSDDLAKLKQGQKPTSSEVRKSVILERKELPPIAKPGATIPPPSPIPSRPPPVPQPPLKQSPPLSYTPSPSLQAPQKRTPPLMPPPPPKMQPLPQAKGHNHPERILSGDELPAFLGAPLPKKKVAKPEEEKIEYSVIARIISSGMTTGIIGTIVLAVALYFLISFFFFSEEAPITTPTPIQTTPTPTTSINELESIFRSVAVIDFSMPQDQKQIVPTLRSLITSQILPKKEFRRINFIAPSTTTQANNFTYILESLSIPYPTEIKSLINDTKTVLLYGQEELIIGQVDPLNDKKLVFIVEVTDLNKITDIMKEWEKTMPNDFKNIFGIDPIKEASKDFLDNERQGTKIRYKNFPLPDKSVDYAIISSLTKRYYLIIAGSRESMFSPIDKIKGL